MNRNEIDESLTWDLSSLFKDQAAINEAFSNATTLLETLKGYEQRICITKENFLTFMNKEEEFTRILENLLCFAKMSTDVDPKDEQAQENLSNAYTLYQKTSVALSFVPLEIIAHKEQITIYLKDDDCKDFRYPMEEILRTIPHRLDEDKEALLAKVAELERVPSDTYESFRLEYNSVHVDGKEEFLNDGTYQQFLKNPNSEVRKEAFENYFGEYKRYQNAFMNMLSGHAKGQVFEANMRHFNSALEASLFGDGADKSLFDKVLYMANEKYIAYNHDYFAYRKQILKLDQQHVYDIQLPLVANVDITYSIDESFAILKEALAPLGEEYVSLLQTARDERWIDFLPCAGKQGGAYSGGSYDSKPFILTNFTSDYNSLSTLAHELGHSMHSYFSRKAN
ncbi:MAG: M3 family metallopeptidase, partial [Longicatena sp.]